MKFVGLNGNEYIINFDKDVKESHSSKLQEEARELIEKRFPASTLYEEVILRGCNNLIADFFIPSLNILIEVHGAQHYIFNKHFHKDIASFKLYQSNDILKQEWCELNNVLYIELPYNKKKEWNEIITESLFRKN